MTTYAFGATARLATTVKLAGVLTSPASVAVTIQLPDGTTSGPLAPTNDGTGLYHYDYTPTLPGRHVARWATTGPVSVDEETLDVLPIFGEAGIIAVADTKSLLKLAADDTSLDAEIAGYIRAVAVICERHVGAIVRTTYTERHSGGYAVALRRMPVLSVTSVVGIGYGVDQAVADLDIDTDAGCFTRLDGRYMQGPFNVTYPAGRADVPANVQLAAAIILQHLWRTRLGGQVPTASVEEQVPRIYGAQVPTGFAIPNRALELLGVQIGGFA